MPSLMMDVRPGERLVLSLGVGVDTVAMVELAQKQKSGQQVRLRVTAPSQVRIEKALADVAHVEPSVAR
jgi:hypothetical protein